jgi:hypothetical protein
MMALYYKDLEVEIKNDWGGGEMEFRILKFGINAILPLGKITSDGGDEEINQAITDYYANKQKQVFDLIRKIDGKGGLG